MSDFEFSENIPTFVTVGMLRDLLKNYPDNTSISVCGTPGLFYPNPEQRHIFLETMDCSGYEALANIEPPATGAVEYMDF